MGARSYLPCNVFFLSSSGGAGSLGLFGLFLLLCGCLFQPRKALIADDVFNPAGVSLRSPGVNACGDKLLGKEAVTLVDFFGNFPANIVLCAVVVVCGGMTGLYAMIGISFFMSIMYPTQFSLAIRDLGQDTKSGSAFLVMAIVGNACLPQLTAYVMTHNPAWYYVAYTIPLLCFAVCAYYGWRGYRVRD